MATRMQQRRGTAQQWLDAEPVTLAAGEIGVETDTNKFKIGDGTSEWQTLEYFATGQAALDAIIDGAPTALNTLNELAAALNDDASFSAYVANALSNQEDALTNAITDVRTDIGQDLSDLANTVATNLGNHDSDTSNVHGIANTLALVDATTLSGAISNALSQASGEAAQAIAAHDLDETNVHGITDAAALVYTSDSRLSDTRTPSDNSVTNAKLADDAVDTAEIKNGAVTNDKLAGSIAQSKITDLVTDLETNANNISLHSGATANVHGIADTSQLVTKDAATQTISGDITVTGSLTVQGNTVTVGANSLVISDPMIYMGENNSGNSVDLGFVSSFNDGTYQHSGFVRDASDNVWKLFKGVTDEPTTTVNFSQGSLDNLAVNNITAAGVVFTDGTQSKEGVPSRTPIISKTASYTLSSLTERDSIVEVSSSSATTITIPEDAVVNYPIGTSIDILQTGSGQVTIAGAEDLGIPLVTVNATPGKKLRTQWSSATLFKRAANSWVVFGDLSA